MVWSEPCYLLPLYRKSPHGGGSFYERMVPTTNNTLKKVDGLLDYERLNNVLIKIENIINSWLLTNVNNKNVNESLTLYNLIHGRNIAKNKVLLLKMGNHYGESLRLNCKKINIVLKHFAKQFTKEYLSVLHERCTYCTGKADKTGILMKPLKNLGTIYDLFKQFMD